MIRVIFSILRRYRSEAAEQHRTYGAGDIVMFVNAGSSPLLKKF
jgi:hypothetical protein